MAKKKITQNINKDAGLLDLPKVRVGRSTWKTEHSNYITSNIGQIVPIYAKEILPFEKKRITMGMLSHMTTPIAPVFNAMYTEFRCFWIPYRLCADLLGGYKTRKSPFVKVFGEDNASANANIVVPLADQKLPDVDGKLAPGFYNHLEPFGGVADALDMDLSQVPTTDNFHRTFFSKMNFLDMAAYELCYQKGYRNQNRESATESDLYKWLFDLYNRTTDNIIYSDKFHIANREKDYFSGASPFTQKGDPVNVSLGDTAKLKVDSESYSLGDTLKLGYEGTASLASAKVQRQSDSSLIVNNTVVAGSNEISATNLVVDLQSAKGINIENLRILLKTQELLEKDMMYGSDYASSLNSHFGTAPMSTVLEEPLELRKVTITSRMQPVFQTSSNPGEATILGTIGANATTQSGEFEILPEYEFKEHGVLMILACHKAQNAYDSALYRKKSIFKKSRFDFYTPELNDLGFQPVSRLEFNVGAYDDDLDEAVGFNEAFAEYRYDFNKCHGMFEASRNNALDYWTLCMSGYEDIQSLYKQSVTELDRSISVASTVSPQFYDAYGFIEINTKPMSLHSIPGFDGVI